MGSPEVPLGQVDVHLERDDVGMAQEGGNGHEVRSAFDHVSGEAVAERVGSHPARDTRALPCPLHDLAQPRPRQAAARDTRFYSAKDPDFFQISRQQQVLDILRNVTTTPPDRVREFSFTAGGGSYAGLFDGTERTLSWDNIVWLNQEVLLP